MKIGNPLVQLTEKRPGRQTNVLEVKFGGFTPLQPSLSSSFLR
jgi:hypothetical protein